jgi:hypothetical protein
MSATFEKQSDSVAVEVTLRKDQGPFVLSLLQIHSAYEARFREIMNELRV